MNTIALRMKGIVDELRNQSDYTELSTTQKATHLKEKRSGDYLIKVGKNNKRNWCGEDMQYIDYTYFGNGWFCLGSRKGAQWFTGKEAFEFIQGKKGFTIVKR
jgi:hypothetical protein